MKKRFAITRTIGNNVTVLKSFDKDCKEKALAYGAEVAKSNTEGSICCVLALFNDEGKMYHNDVRIFEVWMPKEK